MAQRGIREADAKRMIASYLRRHHKGLGVPDDLVLVTKDTDFMELKGREPFLGSSRLVVKPDELIGKRGKNNLILLDADLDKAIGFVKEKGGGDVTIGGKRGRLRHFLIEPFIRHTEEFYVAITTSRDGDIIHFSDRGGVDVEENWDSVSRIRVDLIDGLSRKDLDMLVSSYKVSDHRLVSDFIEALYAAFKEMDFSYLEINPFTIAEGKIVPLDMVAKVDDTAQFMHDWKGLEFPPSFGTAMSNEEKKVKEMDESTGASLKLTVLNPQGRIWTMVAGGGASVVYADTIADLGHASDLANYGEYSGDPSTEETYEYAKIILDLMTRDKDPKGKILIIGGGIANFTDVAKTFRGIILALKEYQQRLIDGGVRIYVRRGGPNYQVGLKSMEVLGKTLGVPIRVFGPETHMTRVISIALAGKASGDN